MGKNRNKKNKTRLKLRSRKGMTLIQCQQKAVIRYIEGEENLLAAQVRSEAKYGNNKLPYDQQRKIDDVNLRINNARSLYRSELETQHRGKVAL